MARPNRPFAGTLAVVNLALLILSGARIAIAAAGVFLTVYLTLSTILRQRLMEHRARSAAGIAVIVATFLWYWPTLEARLFDWESIATVSIGAADVGINLSGRDDVWNFYFQEFLFSPLFGRGVGAGFVAAADWLNRPRTTPHNEYLHLLVNVGVIGFVLCATAIGLWYRRLLQMASEYDPSYLIALLPAIGLFAITEDVLVLSTGLATFAYLAVLLTRRSAITSAPRAGRRHRSRCTRRALREGIALAPARIRNGSGL